MVAHIVTVSDWHTRTGRVVADVLYTFECLNIWILHHLLCEIFHDITILEY